jgi:hypothetical protein
MPIRNNRIVCDLSKVIYAKHYWENQHKQTVPTNPRIPTVFKEAIRPSLYCRPIQGQKETYAETELEACKRLGILDVWFPVTRVQFANNHALEYTGEKAESIWKAWNEKIFSKQKKK